MAKERAIVNRFDGAFPVAADKYEAKYFKHLGSVGKANHALLEPIRKGDINSFEAAIKKMADSMRSHILIIGMCCVIIEREELYADAGYSSYLDYAKHLYEETDLSPQSLSAMKIIIERFMDYSSELKQHGFILEKNSNKLLHLETAFENHKNKNEVFKHIANDMFRDFVDYARTTDTRRRLPPPIPKIQIKSGKILVDGQDFDDLPQSVKKTVENDFSEIYNIRAAGNAPVITPVYDEREARTLRNKIDSFIKEIRKKR
jgi:hypothetical protein